MAPILVLIVVLVVPLPAAARPSPAVQAGQAAEPATTGRVIATVTTLEGTVHLPGVQVELHDVAGDIVLARTQTDDAGRVTFPGVPAGRYLVRATRPGFTPTDSVVFDVRARQTAQVLVDTRLVFEMPAVDVRAPTPSPTDSVQPVSTSDMLAGSLLETAPLEGDDFQHLLPLLPGVVRGPDGRLRIRGGRPTQGALQVSSASLVDPSSGEFDLELPGPSVESVEVLANPFAAEYGRFSTTVTQIRTRPGTNAWHISYGTLVPRFRKWLRGVRGFEPRLSVRGPLRRDRLFVAQDVQFRYLATPVKGLPDEPDMTLVSFDSFTRVDAVLSAGHALDGGLIAFPREVERATMNTFRPPGVTPDFTQQGWAGGLADRFAMTPDVVLESTVAARGFEVDVHADGQRPMVYAPASQNGHYFNDQERDVASVQWVEALSIARDRWWGQHIFKIGTDVQWAGFDGFSASRPLEIRRMDGSLAELTVFGGRTRQEVAGAELAVFAQDRWRLGPRITLELGLRLDRDPVVERVSWSPRGGLALGVLPEGRGILRGGVGRFVQRTPLNVGAFRSYEPRLVTRFARDGSPLGPPVAFAHVVDAGLRTPEATVASVEWDQRFGRRLLLKLAYLERHGSREHILIPDATRGELRLSSRGTSRYRELEATLRYLGGGRRDITVSYVRSKGTADLNDYDQFYGTFRNPIIRPNAHGLVPTDVPHRLLVRGNIGLPGQWDVAPVLELRSGFPWSAVDEYQDFVGPRNRAGRLPAVHTLDFAVSRPWRIRTFRFRAGVRLYNVFGASAERDVQSSVAAPDFGRFYNPIERSIGFVFSTMR